MKIKPSLVKNINLEQCPDCGEDHSTENGEHNHDTEQGSKEPDIGSMIRNIDDIRFLSLYGDINEFQARRITQSLIMFKEQRKLYFNKNNNKETFEVIEPLEFLISSPGGAAGDMFSIYDVMKMVQKEGMEIKTIGVGRVMSAAVPLLAAGTKGKRCAGKNTRIMIHQVSGGIQGKRDEIMNEYNEMVLTQKRYINILSKETKMTKQEIKKLVTSSKDTYISAHQARKWGIIDHVL